MTIATHADDQEAPWEGQEGTSPTRAAPDAYTAAAIRVLSPAEAEESFGFARLAAWQRTYPGNATAFLARLLEACQLSGTDPALAEQRYLAGDRSVTLPPELAEIHRELCRAAHAAA